MFTRRRATDAELQQGEDEMRRAQQRLETELASGTEQQLEDEGKPEVREVYESPKAPKMDEPVGSVDGPKTAPVSFEPPVPDQPVQGLAARSPDQPAGSPDYPKSEPKTPRKAQESMPQRSEGKRQCRLLRLLLILLDHLCQL